MGTGVNQMKAIDVDKFMSELIEYSKKVNRFVGLHEIREMLNKLPDVEIVKNGYWIVHTVPIIIDDCKDEELLYYCSVCRKLDNTHLTPNTICPHCGAKMDLTYTKYLDQANLFDKDCSVCGKHSIRRYVFTDGEFICLKCINEVSNK